MRKLLRQAIADITDLDSRLLKSIRALVLRPGFLTREFFDGRRQAYLSPVKLYVLFSVVYFIVFSFFPDKNLFSAETIYYTDFTGTAERSIEDAIESSRIDRQQLLKKYTSLVSYSVYAVALLFAVLFSLIFIRLKRYFAEHLIYSLHLVSLIFLADIVLLPLYLVWESTHVRVWSIIVVVSSYSIFGIREFYNQPLLRSSAIVLIFSALFWIAGILVGYAVLYATVAAWPSY